MTVVHGPDLPPKGQEMLSSTVWDRRCYLPPCGTGDVWWVHVVVGRSPGEWAWPLTGSRTSLLTGWPCRRPRFTRRRNRTGTPHWSARAGRSRGRGTGTPHWSARAGRSRGRGTGTPHWSARAGRSRGRGGARGPYTGPHGQVGHGAGGGHGDPTLVRTGR